MRLTLSRENYYRLRKGFHCIKIPNGVLLFMIEKSPLIHHPLKLSLEEFGKLVEYCEENLDDLFIYRPVPQGRISKAMRRLYDKINSHPNILQTTEGNLVGMGQDVTGNIVLRCTFTDNHTSYINTGVTLLESIKPIYLPTDNARIELSWEEYILK